ncbi:MAG: hypothetical protein PHH04_05725 [Thomasclavelia sp.]|nr:hypothetical protein [Thomasclavelia sp.]
MNKQIKLTKNGLTVLSIILLVIIIALVMIFGRNALSTDDSNTKTTTPANLSLDSIVVENKQLTVKLLDFVNETNYKDKYQNQSIKINKGTKIAGYKISYDQKFDKVLKMTPPDDSSPKLNNKSENATDNAYVLVLTGDIAMYKQGNKKVYKIVNARIDYYKQALTLESEYDSVYISSIDTKKEKLVKLSEYKEAFNSVDTYMTMLDW